jgi:ribonuclease H / adenosylcobalamin/alpha-ribazole phosphatase
VTRLVVCRHVDPAESGAAEALAHVLRPLTLAAVYTSPLARARDTAAAVARRHALTPEVVDGLREIDLGEVEGRPFDEYPDELQAALLRTPTEASFPGGESFAELTQRVCAAVDEITERHPDATVAVITHAGPIRALLAAWLRIAGDAIFRLDQRFGAVNVVDWIDGVPLVRLVNGTRP